MKKLLVSVVLSGVMINAAFAQDTLKTGIQWDEERARTLALKHIEEEIDVSFFQGLDPQYWENIKPQREVDANTQISHRQVTRFTNNDYAVAYDGEDRVHYYRADGQLVKVSVCSTPFGENVDYSNYPRKCVEYGYPQGKIIAVSLDASPQESFVFLPNGILLNHWIGNKGLDSNDQERYKRQAQ